MGELKGGAMRLGQALAATEAALPVELAGTYRDALTRLVEAAAPVPASVMHAVLAESLGSDWRDRFVGFDDRPTTAASLGQVHRAIWHDGTVVAVKIQFPGMATATPRSLLRAAYHSCFLSSRRSSPPTDCDTAGVALTADSSTQLGAAGPRPTVPARPGRGITSRSGRYALGSSVRSNAYGRSGFDDQSAGLRDQHVSLEARARRPRCDPRSQTAGRVLVSVDAFP